MDVVSYADASRIAGVSRQRITNMKAANDSGKKTYRFFSFDPKTGAPGVDIENRDWKMYVSKDNARRVNKKRLPKRTETQSTEPIEGITSTMQNLLSAVDGAIQDVLNPGEKKLQKVKSEIVRRYSEMVSG
jgi:hypothetical protein